MMRREDNYVLKKQFVVENITLLREMHGLSQADFAKKLEVSKQLVSAWERGLYCPTVRMMVLMMNVFKVDAGYFFEER